MRRCAICKKSIEGCGVTSFMVPRDNERREKWNSICGLKLSKTSRICVDHFSASYIIGSGRHLQLLPNAEPFINSRTDSNTQIPYEQLSENIDQSTEFKCGEIFCCNFEDFRISCDFCNSKQFSLKDFLIHLHNEHFQNIELKTEPFDCIKTENLEVEILQNDEEEVKDGWLESFEELHTLVEKDDTNYISEENEIISDVFYEDIDDGVFLQQEEDVKIVDVKLKNADEVADKDEEVEEEAVSDVKKENKEVKQQEEFIIEKIEPYNFEEDQCSDIESIVDNDYIDEEFTPTTPENNDNNVEEKTVKTLKKRKTSSTKQELPEFQCPECPQQFTLKKHMDNHVFENHGGYKCSKCDKRCRLRQHLIRHEERHNIRQHPCIYCNKVFADIGYWKRHVEEHVSELKFVCPHENCGKRFPSKFRLKVHGRVHTEGYYNTNYINKQINKLNYVCDMCGYSCGALVTLQIHQRMHTGEKPFSCDVCGNRFVSQYALKNHAVIHSDERKFKCDICDAAFKSNKILSRHKFIHSEERKFKCNYCGKAFKQPHCRDAHIKYVHKGIKHIRAKRKRKPKKENPKIDIEILNLDS